MIFIQLPTHTQHPALLCSSLLLLREDVGCFLTFQCTPLPHKHSLARAQISVCSLSFRAGGLGEGFSPDFMPPLESQPPMAPVVPVWEILALFERLTPVSARRGEQSLSSHAEEKKMFSNAAAEHANLLSRSVQHQMKKKNYSQEPVCIIECNNVISMQFTKRIDVSVVLKRAAYL